MKKLIAFSAAMVFAVIVFGQGQETPTYYSTLKGDSAWKWQKQKTNLSVEINSKNADGDFVEKMGNIYKNTVVVSVHLVGPRLPDSLHDGIVTAFNKPNKLVVYTHVDEITLDHYFLRERKKTVYAYCKYDPSTGTINFWQDTHCPVVTFCPWIRFTLIALSMLITWLICFFNSKDQLMMNIVDRVIHGNYLSRKEQNTILHAYFITLPITCIIALFIFYLCNDDLLLRYKANEWYELLVFYAGTFILPVVFMLIELSKIGIQKLKVFIVKQAVI